MTRLFSIKELERLAGVKAHTIRTWERRFNLLQPGRMNNNTRIYTLDEVCTIMDITLLLEYGYKISRLALLKKQETDNELQALKTDDARQKKSIRRLVGYMFCNDTESFENELDDATLFFGIHTTIDAIIIPLLEKINLTSYSDNTIETHFAVTSIRRKLILGIEKATAQNIIKRTGLLFLPAGEHYDLILLYLTYLLKRNGVKVYYLGTNISLKNLDIAISKKKPDFICSYVANKKTFPIGQYAALITESFPDLLFFATYADDLYKKKFPHNDIITYCNYNLLVNSLRSQA